MALVYIVGVFCIILGVSILLKPTSHGINFASTAEWETDPAQAKKKQKEGGVLLGIALIAGGLMLIVSGLI